MHWMNHKMEGKTKQTINFEIPFIHSVLASLLPCPHTLAQVMADTGQFTIDEYTNPGVNYRCIDYQFGDTTCFRTITPRLNKLKKKFCVILYKQNYLVKMNNNKNK